MVREAVVFKSQLISRKWLSEDPFFEVEFTRPLSLYLEPGLVVKIRWKNEERYCIPVSLPQEPTMKLCLRYVKGQALSEVLAHSEMGTLIDFVAPFGYFTFQGFARPAVFIATDIGITAFVSMVSCGTTPACVVHGMTSYESDYYKDCFLRSGSKYIRCFSEGAESDRQPVDAFQGPVWEYVKSSLPRRSYDFYLSGSQEMFRRVVRLIDEEFVGSRVFLEIFCRY
jgi:benzoate/toluate 1,2-dioxygenase reductase subunit